MALRVYDPDHKRPPQQPTAAQTLADFFVWYKTAAEAQAKRPAAATMAKRAAAVAWFCRLMATPGKPNGPPLFQINADALAEFSKRLAVATWTRGPAGIPRRLSAAAQASNLRELATVLRATGPTARRAIRANILATPPDLEAPHVHTWPKETWTLTEAQAIARATLNAPRPRRTISQTQYRNLAAATVAFWFYTGHRAETVLRLQAAALEEYRPGLWRLTIAHSNKTGKPDRLAAHPVLVEALKRCRTTATQNLIPWPIGYRALIDNAEAWQRLAGLTPPRIFSPQAWRRLHAETIAAAGYETARRLAAASLGHSSPTITENHYSAIRNQALMTFPNLFDKKTP